MSFFEKLKLNIAESEAVLESQKPKKRSQPKKAAKETEKAVEEPEDKPKKIPAKRWVSGQNQKVGELAIDVYETEDELVVQSPVAGVQPEELEISVENSMLLIEGERPIPSSEERQNVILQECYWGPFSRRLVLPVEVDGNKIKASLERGVLTIRMPKTEGKRKKRITVEEKEE